MSPLQLYSAQVCPYAQRTRLVLLEKGIDFELIEIDLNHKPQNFLDISPYGKVPVLQHGSVRVWESAVINEYLEEVFPLPALLPQDPAQRAIARIWIDFANTKFVPAFYKVLLAQDRTTQQEWATELEHHLRFMEQAGFQTIAPQSHYWLDTLSLVDMAFAPWFERWPALAYYRQVSIPADCAGLQQWWSLLQARPALQATMQTAEFHIQAYAKYAAATVTGKTAQEMQRY